MDGRSQEVNEVFRELASAYFPRNSRVIARMAASASLSPNVFYAMRRGDIQPYTTILKAAKAAGLLYQQTNQLMTSSVG